jgi:hypothetical protein
LVNPPPAVGAFQEIVPIALKLEGIGIEPPEFAGFQGLITGE